MNARIPEHWPADRVERRDVSLLIPAARNARTHSDEQVAQLAASITEWGWTVPVLVDENDQLIAGHGRVMAAQNLGLREVPVMVAEGWSDAKKRAYAIADNRLPLNAGWDAELLAVELDDLRDLGADLKLLGFEQQELNDLIGTPNMEGLTDPDAVPPVPVDPVSRTGDLWVMGEHRLLVGDCRDAVHVTRLLDNRTINMAFTSPPYAEQRDYDESSGFRTIRPAEYVEWFAPVSANIAAALADDGSWFVNIKPPGAGLDTDLYVFDLVIAHVRRWGWHFATEFCWERNGVPKSVTQRFKNQFEPVYQFTLGRWKMRPDAVRHESDNVPMAGGAGSGNTTWRNAQGGVGTVSVSSSFGAAKKIRDANSGTMAKMQGVPGEPNVAKKPRRNGTSQSSFCATAQGTNAAPGEYIGPGLAYPGNRLPTFSSSHEALGHAAAFPVGLPEFFVLAYTEDGDAIFDPFVGSGSSIMAAERTGRNGYGMDISQKYCDVSVIRWQNATGKQATLDGTGQTFDELSEDRMKVSA